MSTANSFCSSWALISVVLDNHYTTEIILANTVI